MPIREQNRRLQTGPDDGDGRWDAIWRLVLQAEHLPPGERAGFLKSVQSDPFVIRQALAIVEGSESIASAGPSIPLAPHGRFVPQTGQKIGR